MSEFMLDAAGATEAQQRQAMAYLFAQASTGLARTGTLAGLGVAQTTTASDSVTIGSGACVVQASVLTGVALLVNDATKTLDVLTAHPMGGLPRNDIVVFDSATSQIGVVVGTPDATPSDPTVPDTACPLARLRHAASATTVPTSAIDDLRFGTMLHRAMGRLATTGITSSGNVGSTELAVIVTPEFRSPVSNVRIVVKLTLEATDAGSVWLARVRAGSASGTERTSAYAVATHANRTTLAWEDLAAITPGEATTYYVTLQRMAGAGTVRLAGSSRIIVDADPA